jgi:glutamate-ammonia-ligase adenylyltransferase
VYEGDGRTTPSPGSSRFDRFELTDNFHYFTELTQRIIKATSVLGPMGRLYQVDMRLRPTGKSGSLVCPLTEFHRYYASGEAQLWERLSLTRARVVFGNATFAQTVTAALENAAFGHAWRREDLGQILDMRNRLEASRSPRDLKRGFGGFVDIEFLVQAFQLKYGNDRSEVRTPNTWEGLFALRAAGCITEQECATLSSGYDFLRRVESRLRIVQNRAMSDLPDTGEEMEKLARRLGYTAGGVATAGSQFQAELRTHTTQIRELFLKLMERERQ